MAVNRLSSAQEWIELCKRPQFNLGSGHARLDLLRVQKPFEISQDEAGKLIKLAFAETVRRKKGNIPGSMQLPAVMKQFSGNGFPFAQSIIAVGD
jgi:hypothetical protein